MSTAYVYKWTHMPSMMWYIGSRTAKGCCTDDGYICSSKIVRPLIEGKLSDWKREIVATGSKEDMLSLEEDILVLFDAANDMRSFNRRNSVMRKDGSNTTGKKRIHHGTKQLMVKENELPLFLELGWKTGYSEQTLKKYRDAVPDYSGEKNPMYGKKRVAPNKGVAMLDEQKNKLRVPKKKVARECCGIVCSDGNYMRWHGTNCKKQKNSGATNLVAHTNLVVPEINGKTSKGENNV